MLVHKSVYGTTDPADHLDLSISVTRAAAP